MNRWLRYIGLSALVLMVVAFTVNADNHKEEKSFYDFTVKDIDGKKVDLKKYKDHAILIVNVASKCGYTKQYTDLQALYEKYKKKGLIVAGFPANNYGGQEPGSDQEIKEFCTSKFDVSFPMFSKVSVKGDDQHPLFTYLTKKENPDFKGEIKWNFEKFLISPDGKLLHRFRSKVNPMSEEMISAVEKALPKKS